MRWKLIGLASMEQTSDRLRFLGNNKNFNWLNWSNHYSIRFEYECVLCVCVCVWAWARVTRTSAYWTTFKDVYKFMLLNHMLISSLVHSRFVVFVVDVKLIGALCCCRFFFISFHRFYFFGVESSIRWYFSCNWTFLAQSNFYFIMLSFRQITFWLSLVRCNIFPRRSFPSPFYASEAINSLPQLNVFPFVLII